MTVYLPCLVLLDLYDQLHKQLQENENDHRNSVQLFLDLLQAQIITTIVLLAEVQVQPRSEVVILQARPIRIVQKQNRNLNQKWGDQSISLV